MCGRVVRTHSADEIAKALDAINTVPEPLEPDFNIGPTRLLPAVLENRIGEDGEDFQRQLVMLKWGLVPYWAKDPSIGNKMINARVETVATKPAFRSAFAKRRCLVTVSGFYEWQKRESGKQPWYIHPVGGKVLTLAGLFERWKDAEGRLLSTCTILTTTAQDDLGELHDRAPMVVPDEAVDQWLDRTEQNPSSLRQLLVPAIPGTFEAHPVNTAVGNVRNNYPDLIEPVSLDK